MFRVIPVLLAVLFVVVSTPARTTAQLSTPGLVGGLTALPRTDPSTWRDHIVGGGFETTPLAAQGGAWLPATGSEAAWSWDNTGANAHTGKGSMMMSGTGAEAYESLFLPAGTYTFTGYIKTTAGGTGHARLTVDLRGGRYEPVAANCTADCGIDSWYTSQEISAGADWTRASVMFTITDADIAAAKSSVPGRIKAFAVLDGYWAGAGLTAWYDDVKLLQDPGFPIDVFMRYPNYRGMLFSDQSQKVRMRVTPLAQYATAAYRVVGTLRDEAGAVLETVTASLGTLTPDADTGARGLDLTLNNGGKAMAALKDYTPMLAEVKLFDASGKEITPAYPAYRIYKVPATVKPLMNVRFNERNQIVLGIPRPNDPAQNPLTMPPAARFPLGVYDSALAGVSTSTNWEQLLFDPSGARRMSGLPINLYLNYHLGDTDAPAIDNLIAALNNHSVAYLQTGNCFSGTPASAHNAPTGFPIDQPGDGSYPYVSQPPPTGVGQAIGGYYTADECTPELVDGVFSQYRRLVTSDPDSMTFAALLGTNDLPRWRDSVDVLSTDPYPLYGPEPTGGYDHGEVGRWTRMATQAVQRSRPIMTVLQFFPFTSQGRWPTKAEMRNHAYMAIVEGANGLMWWSLGENGLDSICGTSGAWCTQRTELMDRLKSVVSEIASLEPVLLKQDSAQAWGGVTSVTVNGAGVPTSAIATKVKHDDTSPTDPYHVFAYNVTPYYQPGIASPSAAVQFSLAVAPKSIAVYGENRSITPTLTATGATFTDTFGPFEAHVYVIAY